MNLTHINIVARDAKKLAQFYKAIFKCDYAREPRVLTGPKVSRGNGLPNSELLSIWLKFPGCDTPFLELHEHKVSHPRAFPKVNEPGFGHLSFQVADIRKVTSEIIDAGGEPLGEITDFGGPDEPLLIVYIRDPEGNILELEQPHVQQGS